MLDSHVVEFCTLFIITTDNNDNDFKSCIAKPKLFSFFFYFNSWLVYYPFVCALFVINWIKWTLESSWSRLSHPVTRVCCWVKGGNGNKKASMLQSKGT